MQFWLLIALLSAPSWAATVIKVKGQAVAIKLNNDERELWQVGQRASLKSAWGSSAEVEVRKIKNNYALAVVIWGQAQSAQTATLKTGARATSSVANSVHNFKPNIYSETPYSISLSAGSFSFGKWDNSEADITFQNLSSVGLEASYQFSHKWILDAEILSSKGNAKLCAKGGTCGEIQAGHAEFNLVVNYFLYKGFYAHAGAGLSTVIFNLEGAATAGYLTLVGLGYKWKLSESFFTQIEGRYAYHKFTKNRSQIEELDALLLEDRQSLNLGLSLGVSF